MAVQVFNDMPDAAVHRGEPLSGSLRELNARRPLRPHFSGRAVFLGITFALHLGVALAFMQMQARKHVVQQAPPIEVSLIDEAPKAEPPPPVYTPPPVNVAYTLPSPDVAIETEVITTAIATTAITSGDAPSVVPPMVESVEYLRAAPPVYPRESQRRREHGTVILRVLVDAEGRPAQIRVERSSGFERLDSAAREAVAKFLFRPYEVNGTAQPAQVLIPIGFDRRSS
jgi:periplasmic protein TonB